MLWMRCPASSALTCVTRRHRRYLNEGSPMISSLIAENRSSPRRHLCNPAVSQYPLAQEQAAADPGAQRESTL